MSLRTQLTVAGFGLAAIYAAIGIAELVLVGDGQATAIFGASALVTGALVAVLIPLLAPNDGEPGDEGGDDPPGGGDDPPPPPWWPEFERAFWAHVERPPADGGTRRDRRDKAPA